MEPLLPGVPERREVGVMAKIAFIDFETYSTVDLKRAGADAYFEHPDTGIWCLCFCFDGEQDVHVWAPSALHTGSHEAALGIIHHVAVGGAVVAHNASFELLAWKHRMEPAGWPELKPEQTTCTMARAAALALPLDLYSLSKAIGLKTVKDKEGHALMMRMCRPRRWNDDGTPVWWDETPRIARLIEYCKTDVRVEREVYRRLHPLSGPETRLWQLDYTINRRGVQIDVETVHAAARLVAEESHAANTEMAERTDCWLTSASQATALTKWLNEAGVKLDNLQKRTVADTLKRTDLDATARRMLELRQLAGKASTAKLNAMLAAVSDDGRARGLLRFHVASTGRWAGARVQPHNLPRPIFKDATGVLETVRILQEEPNRENILVWAGPVQEAIASCLRSMIIAAPGKELIGGDFSNIEGRVCAWLAGEQWKVNAFREYDAGQGVDLYKLAYARSFGLRTEDVTDHQRQIGKVMELSLQYGGSSGAFSSMAANYGLTVLPPDEGCAKDDLGAGVLTEGTVRKLVSAWRDAHPGIRELWTDLKAAATRAILKPGEPTFTNGVCYKKDGPFLFCNLPSGRRIAYVRPRLEKAVGDDAWKGWQIAYEGMDSFTKKWSVQYAYGGLLCENIVQAVARDCLAEALVNLEAKGYPVVLHVHDEAVAEVPEGHGSLDEFAGCMTNLGRWATGLPVAVKAWRGKRYGLK